MQENKTSYISFSELKCGWFTINDCYKTVNIHPLPKMEPLNSAEKHLITMAFYAIIFQGKKPKMFPRDVGGALAVFLYNNLTIVHSDGSHHFERAFMDSDKLPENIRDAMKPKDECPQQLIDTTNELKKWAEHLLGLDGMNEAFEKSTNRVTVEMAKKVGELVANQMIGELTSNCKENREHLAELSAKIYLNSKHFSEIAEIYRDSEENKLIAMFALLFRLVVQTPQQLMNYYERKGNKDLIKYARINSELIEKQLCKKYLYDIHQRFVQLRPAITHHVAIGLIAAKLEENHFGLAHKAYDELKTWFVSRMEFHGLALLKFKEFRTLKETCEMFRNIMLTTNATQLIAILSAMRIYLCAQSDDEMDGNEVVIVRDMTVWLLAQRLSVQSDDEMEEGNEIVRDMTAWLLKLLEEPKIELDMPNFNKFHRLLGKLAKCFSPKYRVDQKFCYSKISL